MAQSLTTLNVEFASGVVQAMPMHLDGTTHYPIVHDVPIEIGGCFNYSVNLGASINAAVVKSGPGTVFGVHVSSLATGLAFCVKFYNSLATQTAGTMPTGIVRRIVIPLATATSGSRFDIVFPKGIAFTTGISIATSTEQTDAGVTALASATLYSLEIDYA